MNLRAQTFLASMVIAVVCEGSAFATCTAEQRSSVCNCSCNLCPTTFSNSKAVGMCIFGCMQQYNLCYPGPSDLPGCSCTIDLNAIQEIKTLTQGEITKIETKITAEQQSLKGIIQQVSVIEGSIKQTQGTKSEKEDLNKLIQQKTVIEESINQNQEELNNLLQLEKNL